MGGAFTLNKAQLYPTERRPERRSILEEPEEVVVGWFKKTGINIFQGVKQGDKMKAMRLFYTYQDVFEDNICRIEGIAECYP